jgi:hypothetical protein
MLTFAAWRDGHCLGLEELLRSLGLLIETYGWRLTIDWLIPEIEIPKPEYTEPTLMRMS